MKKLQGILDRVLEDAFSVAMATLKEEATGIVASALKRALEARLKALLEEEDEVLAPTLDALTRAKAKATSLEAASLTKEATQEAKEAKPRKRKARVSQALAQDDLTSILEGVRVALEKYRDITTPKGKPYSEVLFRRVKKVLEHAQENGHHNLALLARSALAHIATDPRGVAMGSWQALAAKLGLPIPMAQA